MKEVYSINADTATNVKLSDAVMGFTFKTSVALATESSVYVWSRAPVVKLHKTLNNESG